jgi:hypothetical protein
MQLAEIVYLSDIDARGIVEIVTVHSDMTVYAVRSLDGTLYARTADELAVVTDPAERAELVNDFRILAPHHDELALAVELVQVRQWLVRHGLDKLPALTAELVSVARDADRAAAEATEQALVVMRRIAGATGQPITRTDRERASQWRVTDAARNVLKINGEVIA